MKRNQKTSISLSEDELAILDATASRLNLSRSEVARHLIIYQGLCGGDFPLTTQILSLPEVDQDAVVGEIKARAQSGDPAKPQAFKRWIQEILGNASPETLQRGASELLRSLLAQCSIKRNSNAA